MFINSRDFFCFSFLHPNGLSCVHLTLETSDHHFKSTNSKLKKQVTWQRVEFFGQQAKLLIMHLLPDSLQMTWPYSCKKKDRAQNSTFSLIPQEQIQTAWHHPVNAFTASILTIFQWIDSRNEHSVFCYSKLLILYFLGQNSAEASHFGSFIKSSYRPVKIAAKSMMEKQFEKMMYRYLQELRWWCIIRKQIQSTSNDIRSSSPTIIINRVFSFLEDFNGGKSTNLQDILV